VWRQLKELQGAAWGALPQQDMLAEVVSIALRCARWGAARSLLRETGVAALLPNQAEQIVVSAARSFFYGADSLDSPEVTKV
jgi:neuroblastoma-amplified sequence